MPHPEDPVKLKAWCDGLDRNYAQNAKTWNQYDLTISDTINDYSFHLRKTPGYTPPDWMLVKAQAWVETGANSTKWNRSVLQIGNPGDLGFAQLQKPSGQLIVPPQYKPHLTLGTVQSVPLWNIRAGIGYLLWGAAHFGYLDVPAEGKDLPSHAFNSLQDVVPMPGWSAVQDPFSATIAPGFNGSGHKSRTKKVYAITGWSKIDLQLIAKRYNAGGDKSYLDKLNHAYNLIIKGFPKPGATK